MKNFLFLSVIVLLAFSCRGQEIPDGGPCSYTTINTPATVLEILPVDSDRYEIGFSAVTRNGPDTLYWTNQFTGWATKTDIEKYDIKIGNVFTYEEHEIKSGSCSPYYAKLLMVKFKE